MSGSSVFFANKKKKVQYTSPGSTTFDVPRGIYQIHATIVGGGGGGSRIAGLGGAGGSGGACKEVVLDVTPGETITVVVGSGGAGGILGDLRGKEGGNSSLTGTFGSVRAKGGYGTQSGQSTPLLYPGTGSYYRNVGGGAGGTGNDGTFGAAPGEDGLYGRGGAQGHPNPGSGGGSYGNGGASTSGAGLSGTFGGGGAGGNAADGGDGGSGIIIIRYGDIGST